MNKDIVWLVIVIILGGNTLVMLNSEEANDPNLIDIEEFTCSLGEILVSNTSLVEGYECIEFDPHSIIHAHPAPVLSVGNVIDDGFTIAVFGDVDHLHPDEITVRLSLDEDASVTTQPNTDGFWSLTVQSSAEQIYLNLTASHELEATTSETMFIEINRAVSENETNPNDDGTNAGNNTGDETGGNTTVIGCTDPTAENYNSSATEDDGSCTYPPAPVLGCTDETATNYNAAATEDDGSCQYETDPEDPTGPTQPTYDPSDMGQFWLDVFRCQDGQDITQVDDLTTTATEALECSVSITMNETHITITSNGLPDHDFESTLACSEANDCTRAQNYEWTIPRSPVNDTTGGHDATNCPEANGDYECAPALGEVAIAINGVPFFGPEDGPGGDAVASQHGMYEEDRQNIELGVCHGHSGMGGTYHYHADANCLHWHPEEGEDMFDYDISTPAAVAQNTANGSHSAVIGVSMDGYPIYGLWGYDAQMNVVEMKSSYKLKEGETGYNGIDDYVYVEGLGHLDVCNGHFGPTPEFPDGIYHYHSTMMNGEGEMGFPYFLLCYHGETYLDEGGGGDNPDCSGHGVTWGPGIGPPPEGCGGGGPGAQSAEFQVISSNLTMSPYTMMMIVLFISSVIWHRIK